VISRQQTAIGEPAEMRPWSGSEHPATIALDHLNRWLRYCVGARGIAVVNGSAHEPRLIYESGQTNGAIWPVALAARADGPQTIGPFAIAPLRPTDAQLGALLVLADDRIMARRALEETVNAADMVSAILRGANDERPARNSGDDVQLLLETARALANEPDLDSLFARFHELVTRMLHADGFFVALGEWVSGCMTIPYAVNEGVVERNIGPLPINRSLCGYVFREGKPLLITRPEDFEQYPNVTLGDGDDVASALVVPMRIGARTIGVISVQSTTPGAYTARHRDILVAVGEQAAIAAENAQHIADAEQRAKELTMLADVSRALSLQVSFNTLCRTVSREVRRVMEARSLGVAMFEENGRTAKIEFALTGDVERKYSDCVVEGTVLERVQSERRTVVVTTPLELARYRKRNPIDDDGFAVQSIVAAPLIAANSCLGVLVAQSPRRNAYHDYHKRLMTAIAEQMALAIQNARFSQDARARSLRDQQTGLFHHGYLQTRLEEEIARARAGEGCTGIIMLDVENFKLINATHGHDVGDAVLREVAEVLTATCEPTDVVGRCGADEFMVIRPGCATGETNDLAERLEHRFAQSSLVADGETIPVRCAIGISGYPASGSTGLEVVARAEEAIYESRRGGQSSTRLQRIGPRQLRLRGNFAPVAELVNALLARDGDTASHVEHVNALASAFSLELALSKEETDALLLSSVLHDVGKVAIPSDVLRKPGRLTPQEIQVIRRHPRIGADLLEHTPGFELTADAVLHHHERFDGTGYPHGLAGEAIPLVARVLSIIDAYSAMMIDRPYHKGIPAGAALAELRAHAGSQFDPYLVERFVVLVERLGHDLGRS
jgi:diguanylate cyclase (GGDEF)-like protein